MQNPTRDVLRMGCRRAVVLLRTHCTAKQMQYRSSGTHAGLLLAVNIAAQLNEPLHGDEVLSDGFINSTILTVPFTAKAVMENNASLPPSLLPALLSPIIFLDRS